MCINAKLLKNKGTRKYSDVLKGDAGSCYDIEFIARCGYCIECARRQRSEWSVRCHYESLLNKPSYFITLTYNPEKNPNGMLNYHHVQQFHKDLRSLLCAKTGKTGQYRFFLSGRYSDTFQPHYHIIFFGDMFLDDLKFHCTSKNGHRVYLSSIIQSVWKYGFIAVQIIDTVNRITAYQLDYDADKIDMTAMRKRVYWQVYKQVTADNPNTSQEIVKSICKDTVGNHQEKNISSLSLGWQGFVENLEDYKRDGCVYIDGHKCNIPFSWLKKLANDRTLIEHRQWALDEYNRILSLEKLSLREKLDASIARADLVKKDYIYKRVINPAKYVDSDY